MRHLMTVGVVAAALVAGGCGGDVAEINKVVGDYGRALAAGDGDRACALMTPAGRRGIVRDDAFWVHSCRELAPTLRTVLPGDALRELRHLQIEGVTVTGSRAVGHLAGVHALDRTGETRLRRIDGRWRIDDDHPERG